MPGNLAVGPPVVTPGGGLKGEYWKRPPNTISVLGAADRSLGIDRQIDTFGPPSGTFKATLFNYEGNDLTPVRDWLGSDAAMYVGSTSNLDDGAFRFSGFINVPASGILNIGADSDDGTRILIGDIDIINNDGSHAPQIRDQDVNFLTAGLCPIEINYFNGDYTSDGNHSGNPDPAVHGGATFHLRVNMMRVTATEVAMFHEEAPSFAQSDVTQPGDPITVVNGVNDGDADAGPPPPGEEVEHAIDNVGQKYLNFLDLGSGFAVQPRIGLTVVTGMRLYTANDEEPRDPAGYVLEGSPVGNAGPWTTISSGPLALPSGRNPGGNTPLGANSQTVIFPNSTAYAAYRLTFPTLKDAAAANSMQIGEVELLGFRVASYRDLINFVTAGADPVKTLTFDVDTRNQLVASPSNGVPASAIDYTSWGVRFTRGILYDLYSFGGQPASPPNVITHTSAQPEGGPKVVGIFEPPVHRVGLKNLGAEAELRVYDAAGQLIGAIRSDSDALTADFIGLVSDRPNIARFEFDHVSGNIFRGDDLIFGPPPAVPPFVYIIDPETRPFAESVLDARQNVIPLGAVVNPEGGVEEFGDDVVIIRPANGEELQSFLNRYGGAVISDDSIAPIDPEVIPPDEVRPIQPLGYRLVRVDLGLVALDGFEQNMEILGASGLFRFSSTRARDLIALVAGERLQGRDVAPNLVVRARQ